MKRNTKKPLLPPISVPMHESSEAFKARIEKEELPDDPDVRSSLRGIDKVDSHLKQINQVRGAIMKDQTLNDAAKKSEYLKFLNKVEGRIYQDIQRLANLVDNKQNRIHEIVSGPITEEAGGRFAGEIRSHVAGLEPGERYSFVKRRIDSGDFEGASAVLGSKYYLGGLSEEMQGNLLEYYKSVRFADQFKVKKYMDRVGESVMHKIDMIQRFKKELSNDEAVKALESQRAREAAVNT